MTAAADGRVHTTTASIGEVVHLLQFEPPTEQKLTLDLARDLAEVYSGPALHERARAFVQEADDLGLQVGDRVVLAADTTARFITSFFGCQLAGLVAVPVPARLTGRGSAGARARTAAIWDIVRPRGVVGDDAFVADIDPQGSASRITGETTARPGTSAPRPGPDDVAVLQFTSGSTARPRGCILTHGAVLANLRRLHDAFGVGPGDVTSGWLPLHHDMGLFGLLMLPVFVPGMTLHLQPTERFIMNPLSWLQHLHDVRATISPVPASAIGITAQLMRRRAVDVDLAPMRNLIAGAEMIDPHAARSFLELLRPAQLDPSSLKPAYGLAEVTLFVSKADGLSEVELSRSALRTDGRVGEPSDDTIRMVRLGASHPDEVRIVDDDGVEAPAGVLGEIQLHLPSLMSGYLVADGVDRSSFCEDGWFRTGDLGFIDDDQLVVAGRIKEQLNVGGQKLSPIDIERSIEALPTRRRLTAAAFGVRTPTMPTEMIVIAVEAREDGPALAETIAGACFEETGLRPLDVCLLGPGELPRTTSGKLQRFALRDSFEAGHLVGSLPARGRGAASAPAVPAASGADGAGDRPDAS